ncbi:MAG: transporter [Proteobacteria bacterium]|nr:transporter [Pseudomonadota bacterium]
MDVRIERGQTVGLLGRDDWPLQRVLQTFLRLHERFDHLAAQLSGDEQQMLSIGREFRAVGVPGGAA